MKNFNFHDAFIDGISYDGNTLKFHLGSVLEQDGCCNYIIQTQAEEYDIRFCCLKRYPCLNKVKFKVKEIDIRFVEKLFLRGRKLKIVDAFYATYQNRFMLECDIFPYSADSGCSDKIYLEISDFNDFDIIPNNKKDF